MDPNLVEEIFIKLEEPEPDYFFDNHLITPSKEDNEQGTQSVVETSEEEEENSPPIHNKTTLTPRVGKPVILPIPQLSWPKGRRGSKIRKKALKCQECGLLIENTGNSVHNLKRHQQMHGQGNPCPHCATSFTTRPNLSTHLRRMHSKILLKLQAESTCAICKSPKDLENHVRTRHKIGKCPHCGEEMPVSELAIHKKCHQPPSEDESSYSYQCPHCQNGQFSSYKGLLEHKKRAHPFQAELNGRKVFRQVCSYCGSRCKTRDSLRGHCVARHAGRAVAVAWDPDGGVRRASLESDEIGSEGQPLPINALMTEDDPLKMVKIEILEEEGETILGLDQDTDICDNDPLVTLSTGKVLPPSTSFQNQEEQVHSSQLIQKFGPEQITINQDSSTIARNGRMIFTTAQDSAGRQNVHLQTEIDSDDERFLDQLELEGQADIGSRIKVELEQEFQGPSDHHHGPGLLSNFNYDLIKAEENDNFDPSVTVQYKVEVCNEDNIFL